MTIEWNTIFTFKKPLMVTPGNHYLVPEHMQGSRRDLSVSEALETVDDAEDRFISAMHRLLELNKWSNYSLWFNTLIKLCNNHGGHFSRRAHTDDFLEVTPEDASAPVYWMHIDAIEYDDYPDIDKETIAIHIRPTNDPKHTNGHPQIVDNDEATITLVVERTAKQIAAVYHGRNDSSEAAGSNPLFHISSQEWESLLKEFIA